MPPTHSTCLRDTLPSPTSIAKNISPKNGTRRPSLGGVPVLCFGPVCFTSHPSLQHPPCSITPCVACGLCTPCGRVVQMYFTEAERVVLVSCFDTNPVDSVDATTTDWAGGTGTVKKKGPHPSLLLLSVSPPVSLSSFVPRAGIVSPLRPLPAQGAPLLLPSPHFFSASLFHPRRVCHCCCLPTASPRKRGRVGFADSVRDKPSRGDNAKGGAVAPPSPYESFITGRFAGSKFAVGVSLLGIHMMVSG
jgi:hypothetical protein